MPVVICKVLKGGELNMSKLKNHNHEWWIGHKARMIDELARLESMNWSKDDAVAATIFPYVLVEAINILKNSNIVDAPVDYTKTGKEAEQL